MLLGVYKRESRWRLEASEMVHFRRTRAHFESRKPAKKSSTCGRANELWGVALFETGWLCEESESCVLTKLPLIRYYLS
jgi:hypothetical protein